jgi:hypothetical protein
MQAPANTGNQTHGVWIPVPAGQAQMSKDTLDHATNQSLRRQRHPHILSSTKANEPLFSLLFEAITADASLHGNGQLE